MRKDTHGPCKGISDPEGDSISSAGPDDTEDQKLNDPRTLQELRRRNVLNSLVDYAEQNFDASEDSYLSTLRMDISLGYSRYCTHWLTRTVSWGVLLCLLDAEIETNDKDSILLLPGSLTGGRSPMGARKRKADVERLTAIILDFDKGDATPDKIEARMEELRVESFVYRTFSDQKSVSSLPWLVTQTNSNTGEVKAGPGAFQKFIRDSIGYAVDIDIDVALITSDLAKQFMVDKLGYDSAILGTIEIIDRNGLGRSGKRDKQGIWWDVDKLEIVVSHAPITKTRLVIPLANSFNRTPGESDQDFKRRWKNDVYHPVGGLVGFNFDRSCASIERGHYAMMRRRGTEPSPRWIQGNILDLADPAIQARLAPFKTVESASNPRSRASRSGRKSSKGHGKAHHNARDHARDSESSTYSEPPGQGLPPDYESVLSYLDPDCDYGPWLKVAEALHYETAGGEDGYYVFDDWSSKGTKYKGQYETRAKWRSFSTTVKCPVTCATVVEMAKANGYGKPKGPTSRAKTASHRIHYVSAPCGAGKTYAALQEIAADKHHGHLYVGPTRELLEEVQKSARAAGISTTIITSDTHPHRVIQALIRTIIESPLRGHLILCTHESYMRLSSRAFHRKADFRVWFDEVPQVDTFYQPMINVREHLLALHLDAIPSEQFPEMSELVPKLPNQLQTLLREPNDLVSQTYRSILWDALSDKKTVFVRTDNWKALLTIKHVDSDDERRLYVLSMINGNAFDEVTLLGSRVEESMLFCWLESLGHQWIEDTRTKNRLRYMQYPARIGENLFVSYFAIDAYSKSFRDKICTDGASHGALLLEAVKAEFGDHRFVYVTNNDQEPGWDTDFRMPAYAHGLNKFSDAKRIAFCAAMNRTPQHIRMLRDLGFSQETIRASSTSEVIHQAVMRLAHRNPDFDGQCYVVVPDLITVGYLAEHFGRINFKRLGEAEYRLVDHHEIKTLIRDHEKSRFSTIVFLKGLLSGPGMAYQDVMKAANDAGFSKKQMDTAAKNLKVKKHRCPMTKTTVWSL